MLPINVKNVSNVGRYFCPSYGVWGQVIAALKTYNYEVPKWEGRFLSVWSFRFDSGKLPLQLQPIFRNHADLLQREVFFLLFLWLDNVWTEFMSLEITMVFRNNHFIMLPEYSCEILMCWCQRRQTVAIKETLLHGRRITAVSCPEVNFFLMNLQLFGSSLASLHPCPEPRLWGWHWLPTRMSAQTAEQLRAQQGKQDTSQSPNGERKQPLSFLASQSDVKHTSYVW